MSDLKTLTCDYCGELFLGKTIADEKNNCGCYDEDDTHIFHFKIECFWPGSTLMTRAEAEEFLKHEIKLLEEQWLFGMRGSLITKAELDELELYNRARLNA
ncbi:MAG: hypothetical protein WC307_05975 [Candidatus Nanoarchaeia archaeon]|jgi:hypothetical protein